MQRRTDEGETSGKHRAGVIGSWHVPHVCPFVRCERFSTGLVTTVAVRDQLQTDSTHTHTHTHTLARPAVISVSLSLYPTHISLPPAFSQIPPPSTPTHTNTLQNQHTTSQCQMSPTRLHNNMGSVDFIAPQACGKTLHYQHRSCCKRWSELC